MSERDRGMGWEWQKLECRGMRGRKEQQRLDKQSDAMREPAPPLLLHCVAAVVAEDAAGNRYFRPKFCKVAKPPAAAAALQWRQAAGVWGGGASVQASAASRVNAEKKCRMEKLNDLFPALFFAGQTAG